MRIVKNCSARPEITTSTSATTSAITKITTKLINTETSHNCMSAAKEIGRESPCTENANCISTETSYFCKCRAGHFGNPILNGSCLKDISSKRKVVPQECKFPLLFQEELSNDHSDGFQKLKTLIEELFEELYSRSSFYFKGSTRIFKFR